MTELIEKQIEAASGGNGRTFTLIYHGNGSDGGTVPIDNNNYTAGATVTVSAPGSMSRTGHSFVAWNTMQNGSGTSYEGGYTFNMPANDLTLYAQWSANQYTLSYNGNAHDAGTVPSGDAYRYGT